MASLLFSACATTLLLLFISPAIADVILDSDGVPLLNGKAYRILPYKLIGVGALGVTQGNSSSPCPLYTEPVQEDSEGLPITISSPARIRFLTTHLPIEFYFNSIPSPCNRQLRWYVSTPKDESENAYIVVGVSEEFEEGYVFRIVKAKHGKNAYNIKFCTLLTNKFFTKLSIVEECVDVGLLPDGLLGITTSPNFSVVFVKDPTLRIALN